MAQVYKEEIQREYNCPADKFFEIFSNQISLASNICPDKIKSMEVLQGDGASVGSIVRGECNFENSHHSGTHRVAALDKDNKSITIEVLDGDMTKHHKAIKITVHAIPKGNRCLVNWSAEYEKINSTAPYDLKKYLEYSADLGNDFANFAQKA
ncbi:hypothetical protein U1Q18_002093 [Sarracenia purpurea var. burkii]